MSAEVTNKAIAKQPPPLPTGVPLLQIFAQTTFAHAYEDYGTMVDQSYASDKAYAIKSKLKTALRRYTLPGYGWTTGQKTTDWTEFMRSLPLQDLARALAVQEEVFTQLSETISDESRRTYRSALRQFVEYVQKQAYYQVANGAKETQQTPRMHSHKKRQKHWHRLQREEMPAPVLQELEQFGYYLRHNRAQTPYGSPLNEDTTKRYQRELLDILSWLYRCRGHALESLSLESVVPKSAVIDSTAAAQTVALLSDYLDWLQTELGITLGGQNFVTRSCIYVAEWWEYE